MGSRILAEFIRKEVHWYGGILRHRIPLRLLRELHLCKTGSLTSRIQKWASRFPSSDHQDVAFLFYIFTCFSMRLATCVYKSHIPITAVLPWYHEGANHALERFVHFYQSPTHPYRPICGLLCSVIVCSRAVTLPQNSLHASITINFCPASGARHMQVCLRQVIMVNSTADSHLAKVPCGVSDRALSPIH